MKPNRTKPSKEAGERKALKKAWSKKSKNRVFKHPSKMAHGMSMAQKKDAKEQGFSNVPQLQYLQKQKKKKSGFVARDGEEQVEEGSIGVKKYLRRRQASGQAVDKYLKNTDSDDAYYNKTKKIKPGTRQRRKELGDKAEKAGKDALGSAFKLAKKKEFKRKQKQEVEEGSLGQKKSDRLGKASGKAMTKYLQTQVMNPNDPSLPQKREKHDKLRKAFNKKSTKRFMKKWKKSEQE